jgi:transcriptional regulator with XRE-family HTH domain
MTIGKRIRTERIERKISQEELAKALSTTKQAIYKYENDIVTNIPMDKVAKIAELFNVTPAYLMGWDDDSSSMKKNDAIADIILRLRSDEHFMQVVESLASLSEDQLSAVQTFLSAFKK